MTRVILSLKFMSICLSVTNGFFFFFLLFHYIFLVSFGSLPPFDLPAAGTSLTGACLVWVPYMFSVLFCIVGSSPFGSFNTTLIFHKKKKGL